MGLEKSPLSLPCLVCSFFTLSWQVFMFLSKEFRMLVFTKWESHGISGRFSLLNMSEGVSSNLLVWWNGDTLEWLSNSSKWNRVWSFIWIILFSFFFKQESLLDLQSKITKANCSMVSEQMERILQAYLILLKHANGSKVSLPENVCQVGQTITLYGLPKKYQLNLEEVWSAAASWNVSGA